MTDEERAKHICDGLGLPREAIPSFVREFAQIRQAERDRLATLAALIGAEREMLERVIAAGELSNVELGVALKDGCWICHGDCASANPPVMHCPVRIYYDMNHVLAKARQYGISQS